MTSTTPRVPDRVRDELLVAPRLGILESVRRHLLLFLVPVIVCVGAAAVYGFSREPNYTAEARMGIAKVDVAAPGALAGFTTAAQSLAETYSRVIQAEPVVRDLARQLNSTPERIRARLSAVPVPDTPVFRVVATGPTEDAAVRLANAGTDSLQSYLRKLTADTESTRLLQQYKRAALAASEASAVRSEARAAYEQARTRRNRIALVQADADLAVARVRANSLQEAYALRAQGGTTSSANPQVLARASSAGSDRRSKFQLLVALGLLAGVALGTGLALLRAHLLTRRSILG
jgi:capsular polysaccharide biosynthesis protein